MSDELWKLSDEKILPKQALKFYKVTIHGRRLKSNCLEDLHKSKRA